MAAGGSIFLVAQPFIIKSMQGTDGDVGTSMASYFTAYAFACLGVSFVIGRFNSKRSAQIGAAGCAAAVFGIAATIIYVEHVTHPILMFNLCSAFLGIFTALFWPPLVGWLSAEHEGADLNRRLGSFNLAWSCGGWISPWIGGILVAASTYLPIFITAVIMVLCFVSLRFAKNPGRATPSPSMDSEIGETVCSSQLIRFKWIARIGLVIGFILVGLVRSQMGLLFKFQLGYSESSYGIAITLMAFANFIIYWIAGRIHGWHYKKWVFVVSEIGLAASMILILSCKALWILLAAATIVGITEAVLYTAHLFYGLTGSKRRSSFMAIHELLLSVGIVAGSFVGGHLSDSFGRYMPYWFGLAAIGFAAAIQLAAWFAIRKEPEFQTPTCLNNTSTIV
jgi:MFS family permease